MKSASKYTRNTFSYSLNITDLDNFSGAQTLVQHTYFTTNQLMRINDLVLERDESISLLQQAQKELKQIYDENFRLSQENVKLQNVLIKLEREGFKQAHSGHHFDNSSTCGKNEQLEISPYIMHDKVR